MLRMFIAALAALILSHPARADGRTAHDFTFTDIDGRPMPLSQWKGKAILVVNTASQCGFTVQYAELQQLSERYRERGLVVLGVPSNDFGHQEPGDAGQIKSFTSSRFKLDFPLASKTVVSGKERHPFYAWAAQSLGDSATPHWNFHKYLIDPQGRLVDWFLPFTSPLSDRIVRSVERHLPDAGMSTTKK